MPAEADQQSLDVSPVLVCSIRRSGSLRAFRYALSMVRVYQVYNCLSFSAITVSPELLRGCCRSARGFARRVPRLRRLRAIEMECRPVTLDLPGPGALQCTMPSAPPLSDRALKYGRNVMATSGVIVVLAWVPEIDVEKFKPFGFEISSGGALSIWGVLCAVLVYYFASFIFDSCIDIPVWRDEQKANLVLLRRVKEGLSHNPDELSAVKSTQHTLWRLWVDLGAPTGLFIAAMTAAILRIVDLWPTGANGV